MSKVRSAITDPRRSVFAGADICGEAGLILPAGTARPVFDDDVWDFAKVAGVPVQMGGVMRRFDFAAITDPRWRLVAKEMVFAMLVPRHEAVALLPRAYRTALHLNTANGRLIELARFLNWLTQQGVASLGDIGTDRCEAYLAHRRYVLDKDDVLVGELAPATHRSTAHAIIDLVSYRELFTADRVAPALRPWGGATASAIAEMPSGRTMNKTPPLKDEVLQPMLAAALYLVSTIGPHAAELNRQVSEADRRWAQSSAGDLTKVHRVPLAAFTRLLDRYERDGEPLPLLADHHQQDRVAAGWSPDDPLTPIALNLLSRQADAAPFNHHLLRHPPQPIEATLRSVGAECCFARNGGLAAHAAGQRTAGG